LAKYLNVKEQATILFLSYQNPVLKMRIDCQMFSAENKKRKLCPRFFLLVCIMFSMTVSKAQTSFTFNQIPLSDPDLVAPGRGAEEWMVMNQVNIPLEGVNTQPLDAYYRFEWTQIEKGKGVYDWTALDAAFKRAIDKGQKFSFGIMPLCSTCNGTLINNAKVTYPQYLHNEMQTEGNKDWIYNGVWIPNWNSNYFLTAWENMLKAVSNHINNTSINGIRLSSIVNYIDIRGYGNWGEWHNYPYGNNEPTANKATTTSLIRLINAHKNAFPDIRLVALSDAFDTGNWSDVPAEAGHYLLTASNNAGQFGWRRDNWGDPASWYRAKLENNITTYNGQTFSTLIMNKWKYAPIVGEPSSCCTINGGSCQYWELESQIKRYHTLSFGNGNLESPSSTCVRTNVRNASKASGYRLVVTDGSMTTSLTTGTQFTINLKWQNLGITPTYEKWNVVYQLRNASNQVVWNGTSSFKPQMFLPLASPTLVQDNFTLPVDIPAGTYNFMMVVTDPANYRKPLPLAIKGRNTDGSYLIRSVNVTQSTTTITNKIPLAKAGADQTITLPTNSVQLNGTASSDSDGAIVKYRWSQVGGPGPASFTDYSAATATAQNLLQGVYSFRLTVTDDKNDSSYDDVSVTVLTAPTAPLAATISTISHLKCNGASNGSATVSVTGGTSPYTYSWNTSTPQTTATATGLPAGTYTVKVMDAKSATSSASVTITQPAALDLIVKADSIATYGGTTTVSLSATGGTAPYTFAGQTTWVKAGTYVYTVTDANGCIVSKTYTFGQPGPVTTVAAAPLAATISSATQPSCFGSNNGSATVSVTGGTAPYTYSWNTGTSQTTATATGLTAGSYTVIVKDADQRSASAQVTLHQPTQLYITATPGIILRYGGTTSVTLTASGGIPPYSFTGPVSNVPAGTYTYTVKDAKGCMASTTITISQPVPTGKFKKYNLRPATTSSPAQRYTITMQEDDFVKTYPNPATTSMFVNIENSITGRGTMTIVGMNGIVISSTSFEKSSRAYSATLNVSALPKGTYILKIEFENEKPMISKFIKL
jgi:hypothetical protein